MSRATRGPERPPERAGEGGAAPLLLAVGSRREPKLQAARSAAARVCSSIRARGAGGFDGFAIWSGEIDSGVAETPLDLEALVEGAGRRARRALSAARESGFDAHFGLGLEGGACRGPHGGLYLQSWACVTDGDREAWGGGPALPLPLRIANRLLAGESLAAVIDDAVGGRDVRSREGSFGVLTRGRLSRASIFETALLCAFAPFDRPEFYGD